MQITQRGKRRYVPLIPHQNWLAMKLTVILFFAALFQIHAKGLSQKVNISGKEIPLLKVFREIRKQAGYVVFYNHEFLKEARPVTLDMENSSVEEVLRESLKGQGWNIQLRVRRSLL